MQPIAVEARDLPDAWFQAVSKILDAGRTYTIDRGSYEGKQRLEFDHLTLHVRHPGQRPLLPETPPGSGVPNPVAPDYLDEYLPYLMTDMREPGEQYTYGERLEEQIGEVIEMYQRDGHGTNQACMEVGKPEDIDLSDPPCLRMIDTRISYSSLHFIVYFRSWDLWGGLPANLGGIQLLKEYMAECIGVEDGEIIASSKGVHLYDHCWPLAETVTGKRRAA